MNGWTDGLSDDAWRDRRDRRRRLVALLVILALALPSSAALWSLAS